MASMTNDDGLSPNSIWELNPELGSQTAAEQALPCGPSNPGQKVVLEALCGCEPVGVCSLTDAALSLLTRSTDVGFTPPSSPPTRPRNDRNVFSRLTSNQSQGSALDK